MTSVDSSSILSVGYDLGRGWLDIMFRKGVHYRFLGVPSEVYERLVASTSKGSFFHQEIRGRYLYTVVSAANDDDS